MVHVDYGFCFVLFFPPLVLTLVLQCVYSVSVTEDLRVCLPSKRQVPRAQLMWICVFPNKKKNPRAGTVAQWLRVKAVPAEDWARLPALPVHCLQL